MKHRPKPNFTELHPSIGEAQPQGEWRFGLQPLCIDNTGNNCSMTIDFHLQVIDGMRIDFQLSAGQPGPA